MSKSKAYPMSVTAGVLLVFMGLTHSACAEDSRKSETSETLELAGIANVSRPDGGPAQDRFGAAMKASISLDSTEKVKAPEDGEIRYSESRAPGVYEKSGTVSVSAGF